MIRKHPQTLLCLSLGLLLSSASLLSADELTTVYKAVSKDGSVSFSDEAQQGAEAIKIKPIATVPAIDIKQNKRLATQDKSSVKQYQHLSIISPANNTAFNTGSGDIQVVVQSEPLLKNGDLYVLELDGVEVSAQRNSTFNLKSLDRGTHTLTIKIINPSKQTLNAAISTVTVHRPIKRTY